MGDRCHEGTTNAEFIDACFRRFLRRPADADGLAYYLTRLREGADRLDVVQGIVVSDEFMHLLMKQAFGTHVGTPMLAYVPPGHFYSPIPSTRDVARYASERFDRGPESLVGIDLNVEGQLAMVRTLGPLTRDLTFADDAAGETRYYWENDGFAPGDAAALAAMIRHFQPRRIIEVGAGYSTAVMLDVAERYLSDMPSIECIDPEPQRLRSLLREPDALTVHEAIVQDFPLSFFTGLEPNDILFIDSSHVLKLGSDVSLLLLEVLPRLAPGVLVHVHDIATSFEYPLEWYDEGRAWNEAPMLRAFLAFNPAFEVLFFCDYLVRFQADALGAAMPLALRQPRALAEGNASVSLWLRRRSVHTPGAAFDTPRLRPGPFRYTGARRRRKEGAAMQDVTSHEPREHAYIKSVHGVRYQVKDVARSVAFYTQRLGFTLRHQQLPAFADVTLGEAQILLSGPGASGSRPMPDGQQQQPGGWNRVVLKVADLPGLIAELKEAGLLFRNEMESGPGGRQIQIEDPDGNPIELFEPR